MPSITDHAEIAIVRFTVATASCPCVGVWETHAQHNHCNKTHDMRIIIYDLPGTVGPYRLLVEEGGHVSRQ